MELTNNSNEMKTMVETFVIEETAELIYDNEKLDKWNELVGELGLKGQTKIIKPQKSPIPFLHMKQSLINIFTELCPRKVNVVDYDVTPIPVEILDLIALSNREKYFKEIQIWYDDKTPDPACVGYTTEYQLYHYPGVPAEAKDGIYPTKEDALAEIRKYNPNFSESSYMGWETNQKYYLLGKWADVKRSFDELKEMATKRYIANKGNEYRKQIKEAQRELDDLETNAFEQFN